MSETITDWTYVLAFGANIDGVIGTPRATLDWVIGEFARDGIMVLKISRPIETKPVGGKTRIAYLNAALLVRCAYGPADLLRRLKRLERRAGRRTLARNASRPLDLDILLWRWGRVGSTHAGRRLGVVQVPHPELHKRPFMMAPLAAVLPEWWHPGMRMPGRRLMRRVRVEPGDLSEKTEACAGPGSMAKEG